MLKYSLIPLGILTAILVAAPQLVVVGYLFLIIPGLILTAIPTVFVYLLATFLIRCLLPTQPGVKATMTAACLALLAGFIVMLPSRSAQLRRYQQVALPDITPDQPITLDGNVLLDFPPPGRRAGSSVACDHLCTALLDSPRVQSVTRVYNERAGEETHEVHGATFRRGPAAIGTLVIPEQPQKILEAFDEIEDRYGMQTYKERKTLSRALQAEWALRIADGDVLKMTPVRQGQFTDREPVDWQITCVDLRQRNEPQVQRLEILDRAGTVVARKSLVKHHIPAPIFYLGLYGVSASSGFSGAKFRVGGTRRSNQPRNSRFDSTIEFLRCTTVSRPKPDPDSLARIESTLKRTLDNPTATDAELLLAPMWLKLFQYDAGPEQLDTIAKILLDPRVDDPYEQLHTALKSRTDLTQLREGLAKRFLAAEDPRSRAWYVSELVDLPDTTFARPTDDERAIWNQATTSKEAAPFLERLADRGHEAVPELLKTLELVLEKPWHQRWHVLQGLREAFKRLGPEAEPAIPRIQSLMAQSRSPLTNSAKDRQEWLVALNRMGVDVRELPYGRRVTNMQELEIEVKRVRHQVRRYEDQRAVE